MKTNYLLLLSLFLISLIGYTQQTKEDWVNYVIEKEKGPMVVSSNLWYNYNGKPNYKNLLIVGTTTKNCKRNGYPDFLGLAKLYSFSDSIANILDNTTKNRLVGVLTYQCAGFDVYYVKDTTNLKANIQDFLDYNYALSKNYIDLKPDKKWKYYKESLVPKDVSDSFFTNHEFISQLVSEGDDLTKPRKISHYINFRSDSRRKKFIEQVKKFKFSIDSVSFKKDLSYKYQLIVSREDAITPSHIAKLTEELSKMSLMYYGIYDGWGVEAIKEED